MASSSLNSSMWLNVSDPHAVLDLLRADSEHRAALAHRRQKNRESMQRSRQRQREQLQWLRQAVADLEQQYQALRQRAKRDAGKHIDCNNTRERHAKALELLQQLGAENLFLKASIQSQASWEFDVRRVLETTVMLDGSTTAWHRNTADPPSGSPLPIHIDLLNAHEAEVVFGHRERSERDVKHVILHNTQAVKHVQVQLLEPNSYGNGFEVDRADVFGWDARRRVRGSFMDFVFTKRFTTATVSVAELMHKTWAHGLHLDSARAIERDIQRLDVLQKVNDNAYVLGRDVQSPDQPSVFRTTLLHYRMQTTGKVPFNGSSLLSSRAERVETSPRLRARGYVIGTQSLNPAATSSAKLFPDRAGMEPYAPLVWAELALTIEMLQVSDCVTGEDKYMQVRWSGQANYGSSNDAHRNAADIVTTVMRWELGTIAPVIQLNLTVDSVERDVTHEMASK
ncbi:unnamed protein product [Hyaloperonospora brassicae]|uniref:BZIP domain-containing protein n=1 Tax=Hyaloperonospora brassicae TaxID=162125 RepID=A0AAV0U7C0_HYABA|nr:unnamed protein product [Hyaloperonospora brassicae]